MSKLRPGLYDVPVTAGVLLGRCFHRTHRAGRPMPIEWDLERPMPPGFYKETKLAAG